MPPSAAAVRYTQIALHGFGRPNDGRNAVPGACSEEAKEVGGESSSAHTLTNHSN